MKFLDSFIYNEESFWKDIITKGPLFKTEIFYNLFLL